VNLRNLPRLQRAVLEMAGPQLRNPYRIAAMLGEPIGPVKATVKGLSRRRLVTCAGAFCPVRLTAAGREVLEEENPAALLDPTTGESRYRKEIRRDMAAAGWRVLADSEGWVGVHRDGRTVVASSLAALERASRRGPA